jgi:hypothetical protein
MIKTLSIALLFFLGAFGSEASDWVRAGLNTNQPVWGIQGGLQFALHPFGFRGGKSGPRGLIRVGSPILEKGEYSLVNFIAVEPIVDGKRGLSELEHSKLDDAPGKRFWVDEPPDSPSSLNPGKLSKLNAGVEQLEVTVRVEKFDNGADVFLTLSQRSDAPDELQITIHPEKDSAPMKFCILTATMGNFARIRQLWLKDTMLTSQELYPNYREKDFAPQTSFSLDQLYRTEHGDVLMAATTNEKSLATVFPFGNSRRWYYGGAAMTQFWKKKAGTFHDGLEGVVNARFLYWKSDQPIPGGIAFENFELREPFYPGQQFIFGITRRTPLDLGFKSN